MLVNTNFAVVLFCTTCGRMHLEEVSIFAVQAKTKDITCGTCRKHLGCMRALKNGRYMLSFGSSNNWDIHVVRFSRSILISEKVYPFSSFSSPSEGGFVGSVSAVEQELSLLKQEFSVAPSEYELQDDIDAPEVMFEVINRVDDLAVSGSICCGNCGQKEIGLEVFGSFILLYCSHCGNMYEISAKYQEDAKNIKNINFIELQPISEL